MASVPPKRSNIQYKYAIGIALKNRQPLRVKEIYDFIKVYMPKVCTSYSNYWENTVRSNLATSEFFEKVDKGLTGSKSSYQFSVGAEEQFNKLFPSTYGHPYDFLAHPELHLKLYNGQIGYPSYQQIEAARNQFNKRMRLWTFPEEIKQTIKENELKKVRIITKGEIWAGTPFSANFRNCGNIEMQLEKENVIRHENRKYHYESADVLQSTQNQGSHCENLRVNDQSSPGPQRKISTASQRLSPYLFPVAIVQKKHVLLVKQEPRRPHLQPAAIAVRSPLIPRHGSAQRRECVNIILKKNQPGHYSQKRQEYSTVQMPPYQNQRKVLWKKTAHSRLGSHQVPLLRPTIVVDQFQKASQRSYNHNQHEEVLSSNSTVKQQLHSKPPEVKQEIFDHQRVSYQQNAQVSRLYQSEPTPLMEHNRQFHQMPLIKEEEIFAPFPVEQHLPCPPDLQEDQDFMTLLSEAEDEYDQFAYLFDPSTDSTSNEDSSLEEELKLMHSVKEEISLDNVLMPLHDDYYGFPHIDLISEF